MELSTHVSIVYPDGRQESVALETVLERSPRTILYFYPKDNTPGCTMEAQDFTRLSVEFAKKGIVVYGVSEDSEVDHAEFILDCHLWIPLISDMGILHEAFEVKGEKNMYGRIVEGTIRSTFLLNSDGEILSEWRNVKATGHAERVLREA